MNATHTENLNHTLPDQELRAAIERFEMCLLSPIVSGELVDWVAEVQKTWCDATEQVREHTSELHPRQFKQISKEDPELLPKTERLQAEDAVIAESVEEFDRSLRRFAEHAPKFEPDEEKIAHHAQKLIDQGVALVTQVRKQEAALQTWFMEAFTRDRGVAD